MSSSFSGNVRGTGYRIVVAADNTQVSKKAIRFAVQLYRRLEGTDNSLEIIYAVGLNPTSETTLSLFGGLDRTNNLDIENSAKEDLEGLEQFMTDYKNLVDFKLFMVQDTKSVEEILTGYINKDPPNLVVIGSTNKEGISR
ncbi:hypothetical protein J3Q64DRAFT_1772412 [Phycomyces blakesleeanus]